MSKNHCITDCWETTLFLYSSINGSREQHAHGLFTATLEASAAVNEKQSLLCEIIANVNAKLTIASF